MAAEDAGCRPFTGKEINSIKTSQNPKLLTGAGLTDLVDPALGRELLESASRIEAPSGTGTFSLIDIDFDHPWAESPLKPSSQVNIMKLLRDDNDNAQSYYLYAVLQQEAMGDKEAIAQITKGNAKTFKTYSKRRFDAIVDAVALVKCSGIKARQYAFSRFFTSNTYSKLRHLCRDLMRSDGKEAKNACFLMGQNLERGSLTFVEQLISLSIQNDTLGDSSSDAAAKSEIQNRRSLIAAKIGRNANAAEGSMPEEVSLQYYQILFEKGEAAARDFVTDFVEQKQQAH